MKLSEFELIARFFARAKKSNAATRLGVGDDCALLAPPCSAELAVTTDTLIEGVHFLPDSEPEALGYKALAVSLSDLAAMGALPVWASLALSLPEAEEHWVAAFARGFFDVAGRFGVDLIGGDTTSGPRVITVHAMGLVPKGEALLRSNAQAGDLVYVTGLLGEAGLGLRMVRREVRIDAPEALERLHRPWPRVDAGLRLRSLAHACIDISDGLAGDLGHILEASGVGATIEWSSLPLSPHLKAYIAQSGDWELPLHAGDDYELCFTLSPGQQRALESRVEDFDCLLTCIGVIDARPGLRLKKDGMKINIPATGFVHFA